MLRGFEPRLYQETILATAATKNTLVVLPTGMGKTGVALILAAQRLSRFPNSKIVFVTPTKPLADQHFRTFLKHLNVEEDKIMLFTGSVPPEKRAHMWKDAKIILATPQGVENDVMGGKIDLSDVSLFIFDEAHRATGDYSYVFLAKQYNRKASWPRILALTASPGSELEKIEEMCKNLFIEYVEIRTEDDPDVQPYIQQVDIERVKVDLPDEFKKVKSMLDRCLNERLSELRNLGARITGYVNKTELLRAQRELQARMSSGERDPQIFRSLSILAEVMKVQHAVELLETQGVTPLHKYMSGLFRSADSSKVKAVKNLVANVYFKTAYVLTQKLFDNGLEHPKVESVKNRILDELGKNKKAKIILFTQFRDTASKLEDVLIKDGILAQVFVGQAKRGDTGLSQKEQIAMINEFKDGMFNVLIATSVAEEGLDIPSVDAVFFYEPIPSAIRTIQRRGRTGRLEKGKVVVFLARGTRDEGYSWSARAKEKKMKTVLEKLQGQMMTRATQQILPAFNDPEVKIFADYREKGTGVVKQLVEVGVQVKLEMLKTADYVVSSRVGIELKTVEDFVNSIIDGRLLEQAKALKGGFERPVLIIQGSEDIYSIRNVNQNAIRGMIATIAISYGIPIITSKDDKDTAQLIIAMAKREQSKEKSNFNPHADRKPLTLKDQQEYLVSSLPGIGLSAAKELLKTFCSVQAVFNASAEELQTVPGIGPKTADRILEVTRSKY